MKMEKYILEGHIPKLVDDAIEWAKWFETADRQIAQIDIDIPAWKYHLGKWLKIKRWQPVYISTVFLGLNHNFGEGKPLLFETMVFGGEYNGRMNRYSTWDEASKGHEQMVWAVKTKNL